ncbi:MAG: hypothetical protein HOQ24_17335 [Mycobacteriaceae bacterium]|nr:hypothetical protein [Mycobacteriaceae bacterium]
MTALWFGLAAACLAGAGVLLYIDRLRRQRSGRVRQVWARNHGYSYKALDTTLPQQWRRATLAKQGYLSAVDIVSGTRRGVRFTLFDLEDSATIVAVQRRIGSDVDVDLRLKTMPPPKDPDLELLGGMGERVVFASDVDIARRVCDERMAALAEILPDTLQVLWSENTWTLGSLPASASQRDWDLTIDGVIRFSGLLHVLPPGAAADSAGADRRRSRRSARLAPEPEPERWEPEERDYRDSVADLDDYRSRGESPAGADRRDEDHRSADSGSDAEQSDAEQSDTEQSGDDPFHPGFRPYQGPGARS